MKTCPLCETAYPSHHTNCPKDGALLIDRRELDPGTVIRGKYRIVRLLGRGGMGTVYLAQHILLGRLRALKFISSELSPDPAFLRRFRREAQAAIEFQHPNIVQVVDLDQAEDGSPFIAMEYVEGPDLRQALTKAAQERNFGLDTCQGTTSVVPQMPQNERWALAPEGAFPVPRALAIARGVAQALGAAHAKGIVHRDIKPENILLTGGNGQPEIPKLFDFGIASIKQPATAITTRGFILTPQYAAPEQWKGLPAEDLDARTDLYALGGVLYEMLTGQTCFEAHNTEGWMFQHLTADPEPPSHLRPELANWPGLDALVLRLLARNREQRPKDAAELVGLLDAARYLTLDGQRATEREGTALVEGRAGKRWHRRVPGWMWPTSFLAFLAALVATWTLVSRLHPSPQPQQASQPANGAAIDHNASAKPYLVIPIRQPQKAQVEDSKPPGRKPSIAETEQQAEALFNQRQFLEAEPLFEKACSGGNADACFYLGKMYGEGLGVSQDYSRALPLYSKACDAGEAMACNNLGLMYANGNGAPKEDSRAVSPGAPPLNEPQSLGAPSFAFL